MTGDPACDFDASARTRPSARAHAAATGGDAVVEALVRHGVSDVFGIPGAQTYSLFDALHRRGVRTITPRHEQTAAYMAFGYAQSSARAGVFSVVPGPGVLDASAALATAAACHVPVLCLAGQVPTPAIGQRRGALHELPDQLGLLRKLVPWAKRVDDPQAIGATIAEAWRAMCSGRRGAVAVELPWDVLTATIDAVPVPPLPVTPEPTIFELQLALAGRLLARARRPLLWVGSGALGARAEVDELSCMLGAPVATFRGGRGLIADDDPRALSVASAWHVWPAVDVVVAIGTRMEPPLMHWPARDRAPTIIRIDIDADELVRIPVAIGVHGDAAEVVRALIERLRRDGHRTAALDDVERARAAATAELAAIQPQADYLAVIRDVLPRDGFFVEEYCQAGYASWYGFPIYEPRTFVRGGYFGNLGFGYATALGVAAAHPQHAVVSISGDGGFQYTLPELATAVQYRLAVTAVVFDNGGYANVRRDQQRAYDGRIHGADLRNPDFVRVAEAYGVGAAAVDTPAALRRELEVALASGEPRVIVVRVPRDSESSPWPPVLRGAR